MRAAIAGIMASGWLGLAAAAFGQGATTGCPATAERAWIDGGSVSAAAVGPNCAQAALLLTLRDAEGALIYAAADQPSDLFGFEDVATPETMTAALLDWIGQSGAGFDSTADLPEWENGGEFPFYPDDWLDAETYGRLREAAAPMFCYVQGRESMACVAFFADIGEKGVWMRFGAQSFPG